VCTRYDRADADAATVKDAIGRGLKVSGSYAGRVASVTDKAQKTVLAYDGRGRVTGRLKRVALVDAANASQPKQLAPRAYLQEIAYDEANRVVTETTGVTSTALQGAGGSSTVTSVWDKRGAVSAVTSSYGELVSRVTRDAQGRVTEIAYADAAKTTTQMVYDVRGRLVNTQTFRTKPSWWAAGGTGAPVSYKAPASTDPVQQLVLESRSVSYDEADNPVVIAARANSRVDREDDERAALDGDGNAITLGDDQLRIASRFGDRRQCPTNTARAFAARDASRRCRSVPGSATKS
jgi:YD repeat-containing protein